MWYFSDQLSLETRSLDLHNQVREFQVSVLSSHIKDIIFQLVDHLGSLHAQDFSPNWHPISGHDINFGGLLPNNLEKRRL